MLNGILLFLCFYSMIDAETRCHLNNKTYFCRNAKQPNFYGYYTCQSKN